MPRSRVLPAVFLLTLSGLCSAQDSFRRVEIGLRSSVLRTSAPGDACTVCPRPRWAVGPAATVNLTQYFALDGAFGYFPDRAGTRPGMSVGSATQALLGLKASIRSPRFALFAKVRPGYVRFSRGRLFEHGGTPGRPGLNYNFSPGTNFALDLGGGIEYALSPRIALRSEAGDTLMLWNSQSEERGSDTGLHGRHSLQISNSVMYSVGKTVPLERMSRPEETHKFFDRTNIALFSTSLLAQTADMVTTQRFIGNCRNHPPSSRFDCGQLEANPLARPFVRHGWAGQIGLAVIVNTAQISIIYVVHRMRHHRVERFLTLPTTAASIWAAASNMNDQ